MDELLNNPASQAGVVPFMVALVVAALLQRTRLIGLAIIGGLVAVVGLTMGFTFETLTGVRKLLLAVLMAGAVAGVIELTKASGQLK